MDAAMQQRVPLAATVLTFVVVAAAWWGLSSVGTTQPAVNATTTAEGRIEGGGNVFSVGTSATGTVAELMVAPGAHVEKGQHLARIECSQIERELEARKADLDATEAIFLRTVHGPRQEEISVGIANVHLAEARSEEADKALQRTMQLREGFTVTRVQIDQAQRDARIAHALLDEVRAKLDLLMAGSRAEDITEAHSRRDAAKGRVDEAAARLGYCTVDAPISGLVLSTHVSPGQLVSSMVPVTLLTLVDDSKRRVRALVDERETAKLCPGQRSQISADGIPGVRAEGTVETVGVEVENSGNPSRQVRQVVLAIPVDQPQLPIGLRVSVQFSPCTPAQRGGGR
jgi:HlyD family secretion protein